MLGGRDPADVTAANLRARHDQAIADREARLAAEAREREEMAERARTAEIRKEEEREKSNQERIDQEIRDKLLTFINDFVRELEEAASQDGPPYVRCILGQWSVTRETYSYPGSNEWHTPSSRQDRADENRARRVILNIPEYTEFESFCGSQGYRVRLFTYEFTRDNMMGGFSEPGDPVRSNKTQVTSVALEVGF